jgi:hypothetical protein
MFRELIVGVREIVNAHDLEDVVVWKITRHLEEIFGAHVWRRCEGDPQSLRAMSREIVVRMRELIDAQGLDDHVVWHIAEVLDDVFERYTVRPRTRHAPVQELFHRLFAIDEGGSDEKQALDRELLDDLLATYLKRRTKARKPRRQGPHPAMVELLARLDRYGSDNEKAQSKAARSAD